MSEKQLSLPYQEFILSLVGEVDDDEVKLFIYSLLNN